MKKLFTTLGVSALLATVQLHAQNIPNLGVGSTFTVKGQTFTIATNAAGQIVTTESGPAGNAQALTPQSLSQAAQSIGSDIQANNPANTNFYSANEWEGRVGGAYEQNSGQAAALISVEKWGLLSSAPNLGLEAALLQGNQNGSSGTAAGYGSINYRRIIGDVAADVGIGGGYDNYNNKPFALLKAGVEYRQNQHVGVFTDINFALESKGNESRGFGFAGGVIYAF